jgi:putative DNA primase/helicase
MSTVLDPRNIAHILGGDVIGRNSVSAPGPGHSKADRSLSLKLDSGAPEGFVVYDHAGRDHIGYRDYVRERLGLGSWRPGQKRQAPQFKVKDSGPDHEAEKKKAWALRIWSESVNPMGTLAERYLQKHRGLELPPDIAGGVIRFHRGLKFDDKYLPGMVCLFRNIKTNEPCGIHRTFLDHATAEKIDRRMLGIAGGAAIKFDGAISSLTIGEGIETVLSGRAFGLGPCWALGSSGAVGSFPVVKSLAEITILAENDLASQRKVATCAERYRSAGKPVNIITPNIGNDLNDSWRATQ